MNEALCGVVKKLIGPEILKSIAEGDISRVGDVEDIIANHVRSDVKDANHESVLAVLREGVIESTDVDILDDMEVREDICTALLNAAYSVFGLSFKNTESVLAVMDKIRVTIKGEDIPHFNNVRSAITESPDRRQITAAISLFHLQSAYPQFANVLSRCVDYNGVWLLQDTPLEDIMKGIDVNSL